MRKVGMLACSVVIAFGVGAASSAKDGKSLYASKCAGCHGHDGVPKKSGAGSKAFGDPEYKTSATVDSIVAITLHGKNKMKPVKNVTEDQAKKIAAYILSMAPTK